MSLADLVRWLCSHYGNAESLADIKPYGPNARPAHSVMHGVTLGATVGANIDDENDVITVLLKDARLNRQPQPRNTATMCNLDHACVHSVVVRHVVSSVPSTVAVRLNYMHPGLARTERTEDVHKLVEAFGGVRGAFALVNQTEHQGTRANHVALRALPFHYTNVGFVETMALVNERNMRNGITQIPRELTGALYTQKLPQLPKDTAAPDDYTEWFAVPADHVLAWPLHTDDATRTKAGVRAMELRAPHGRGTVFFLVHGPSFHLLVRVFCESWLGQVDTRPLNGIGLEFVKKNAKASGRIELRVNVGYLVPEQGIDIDSLAPMLGPRMPPYTSWVPETAERAVRYGEQKARKL